MVINQRIPGLAAILRVHVVLCGYFHAFVDDFGKAVRADEKIYGWIRFQLIFMHGDADVFELRVQRRLATVQYQPFPGPIQFRRLVKEVLQLLEGHCFIARRLGYQIGTMRAAQIAAISDVDFKVPDVRDMIGWDRVAQIKSLYSISAVD